MTIPARAIPAVSLQSSPAYCLLCHTKRWMRYGIPGQAPVTPIRCPQCTSSADLLALLAVTR